MTIPPIHTDAINGYPLRFFRDPSSKFEFPWHCIEDLLACMGLPRDVQRKLRQVLRSGSCKDDMRVVVTDAGAVTVGPHWIAQALIRAMIERDYISEDFRAAYIKASIAALRSLASDPSMRTSFEGTGVPGGLKVTDRCNRRVGA